MSNLKCKICLSANTEKLFESFNTHGRDIVDKKDKFQVYRCKECGLIFLDGIEVNKKYYDKYYEEDYYKRGGVNLGPSGLFLNLLSRFSTNRKQKLILKVLGKKKGKISILDIGCGTGGFLESLDTSRFDKYGCEVSSEGYKACVKKGLSVYHGDVCGIDFKDKKFDVVTLWHVLEHIENPKKVFEKIRESLSDDGVLIFQVPNTDGLGFRIGREYWFHMDSPRHLILYNRKSVEKLCQINNFKVIFVINEFYDFPLDLFWSVRRSKLRFLIYPFYFLFKVFSREHLTFLCKK